jgi:hypothetical protein
MMGVRRAGSAALLLLWIAGEGCTAIREIPRGEYASVGERKNVRLTTREGLHYELDYVKVQGDSLIGYRRRDVEGPIDEFIQLQLPLDDVQTLSTRTLDWKRTGLVGGGAVAVVAVLGLRKIIQNNGNDSSGGTGKDPGGTP